MELGTVVTTQGIANAMQESNAFKQEIERAFTRYSNGDWGDTCKEDKESNDRAEEMQTRVVALYHTSKGDVFIITEWDRSVTTILFASEY